MKRRKTIWASLIVLGIIALAAFPLAHLWSPDSKESAISMVQPPPSTPASIMISCGKGNEFGWTAYPRGPMQSKDLAPAWAIFARCIPDENFVYDVQSSGPEISDTMRRPEVSLLLGSDGQVKDAFVSRTSGSPSLDTKILEMVRSRK